MEALRGKEIRTTVFLLAVAMVLGLAIRLLPAASLAGTGILPGVDTYYTLRQIEVMVHSFPLYNWYDPFTAFPQGKVVDWGPLFPSIAAAAAIAAGASTRPEIIGVVSFIPAILAVLTIPLVYGIGKALQGWETGGFAALFFVFASLPSIYRSSFGYIDHHVAEVLFSTLFCLAYIVAVQEGGKITAPVTRIADYSTPLIYAALAGIAFLLGYFTMPTILLFGLVTALFSIVQFTRDHCEGRKSGYLLLVNLTAFSIPLPGIACFGIHVPGFSLSQYTAGPVLAILLLLTLSTVLFLFQHFFAGRPHPYLAAVGVMMLLGVVGIIAADTLAGTMFLPVIVSFFGQGAVSATITEMSGLTLSYALKSLNAGLLLMALGFGTVALQLGRSNSPGFMFLLVWSAVILFSTIQHMRFEYYLAVNVALLAAAGCVTVLSRSPGDAAAFFMGKEIPEDVGGRKQKHSKRAGTHPAAGMSVLVLILLFGAISVGQGVYMGMNARSTVIITEDWSEAMAWLEENTPDPGIEYLGEYVQDEFVYPTSSYGVLSWWDYGHLITTLGRRIPNTNPFQDNILGPQGAAAFFMSCDEEEATGIAESLGSTYIITNQEMALQDFGAIASIHDPDQKESPYISVFRDDRDNQPYFLAFNAPYFHTMVARLHMLDGTWVEPESALYIGFHTDPESGGWVADTTERGAVSTIRQEVLEDAAGFTYGRDSGIFAERPYEPLDAVPALRHFRLVYEAEGVITDGERNISTIKIFEFVPGARIPGEGFIEVPVVTNTGRTFTYRQESRDGEFIVPYATGGQVNGVHTAGPYRILSSGREYRVGEEDVRHGSTVS